MADGGFPRITSLILSDNNLEGSIPAALSNPPNLKTLDLSRNHFSGTIPSSLGSLTNLRHLSLAANIDNPKLKHPPRLCPWEDDTPEQGRKKVLFHSGLEGFIPASICNLRNLTDLRLDRNQLSGPIPVAIGQLVSLAVLSLHDNLLNGQIPLSL